MHSMCKCCADCIVPAFVSITNDERTISVADEEERTLRIYSLTRVWTDMPLGETPTPPRWEIDKVKGYMTDNLAVTQSIIEEVCAREMKGGDDG